jgi:hypothetical protein
VNPVHEIHSSGLRGYRRCRQEWDWHYRENWEPIKKPEALEDGTVWHAALQALYNPETWALSLKELHGLAHAALMQETNKQLSEYLERSGKHQLDEDEALEYADRVDLLRSMLVKLCRSLEREKYRPLFVEQEFQCPILNELGQQLTCRCASCQNQMLQSGHDAPRSTALWAVGLPVVFSCRIDAGFEDQEGYVYAVDHKSTSILYKPDSVIPELEDQLPSYLWCLKQSGYNVTGVILNQFRKAYPKSPKRLERMTNGRLYSVNKMQLTDYDVARPTFMRGDARAYQHGLYNDYLQWLQEFGPVFARQFSFFKTPEQLAIIGQNILLQAREVIDEGPSIYPDPHRINCDRCAFQSPCLAKQGGHDYRGELEASFVQSEPYYIRRRQVS